MKKIKFGSLLVVSSLLMTSCVGYITPEGAIVSAPTAVVVEPYYYPTIVEIDPYFYGYWSGEIWIGPGPRPFFHAPVGHFHDHDFRSGGHSGGHQEGHPSGEHGPSPRR